METWDLKPFRVFCVHIKHTDFLPGTCSQSGCVRTDVALPSHGLQYLAPILSSRHLQPIRMCVHRGRSSLPRAEKGEKGSAIKFNGITRVSQFAEPWFEMVCLFTFEFYDFKLLESWWNQIRVGLNRGMACETLLGWILQGSILLDTHSRRSFIRPDSSIRSCGFWRKILKFMREPNCGLDCTESVQLCLKLKAMEKKCSVKENISGIQADTAGEV